MDKDIGQVAGVVVVRVELELSGPGVDVAVSLASSDKNTVKVVIASWNKFDEAFYKLLT